MPRWDEAARARQGERMRALHAEGKVAGGDRRKPSTSDLDLARSALRRVLKSKDASPAQTVRAARALMTSHPESQEELTAAEVDACVLSLLSYRFEPPLFAELLEWVGAILTLGEEPDADPERVERIREAALRIHARRQLDRDDLDETVERLLESDPAMMIDRASEELASL
jgi:hypothetical protein